MESAEKDICEVAGALPIASAASLCELMDALVIVKEWTGEPEPQWPEWAVSLIGVYGPDGAPVNVREMFDVIRSGQQKMEAV